MASFNVGQRLRAAGVPLEDRKALLGHKCGDVTTHYSAPEVAKVIEYVERVCVERPNTVLRLASPANVEALEGHSKCLMRLANWWSRWGSNPRPPHCEGRVTTVTHCFVTLIGAPRTQRSQKRSEAHKRD